MSVIDPSYDMPFSDYGQEGSFVAPIIPPLNGPLDGVLVSLPCINPDWLRILLGAVDQLRNPSTWKGLNALQLVQVLGQVEDLRGALQVAQPCCNVAMRLTADCHLQFSTDGGSTWTTASGWDANLNGCVRSNIPQPIPPTPPGQTVNQHACNLSGYIASEIIKKAITDAVTAFNNTLTAIHYANDIMASLAFAFPITSLAFQAFTDLYALYNSGTIGDFTFAETDPALWSSVTCAIYNAIKNVGYINSANLPAVISNVCGLVYVHPDVISAICGFLTTVGLTNIQAMQTAGAYDEVDCTSCGTWCWQFDFTLGMQGWSILSSGGTAEGSWVAGVGFRTVTFGGQAVLAIQYSLPQPMTLTHLNLTFTSDCAASSPGERFHRLRSSGVTVAQYFIDPAIEPAPVHSSSGPISVFCDTIILVMECDALGNIIVPNYQIQGNGPNPFGVDNCTY